MITSSYKEHARTPFDLGTGMNFSPICHLQTLDGAIQRKEMDPRVKPEDDGMESDFCALRSSGFLTDNEPQ